MGGQGAAVRVLYVDDERQYRDLLCDTLPEADDRLVVDTHDDAASVVDRLRAGDYDCLLCDYDMPARDGLAVFEVVREAFPDLPFVLYTGKGSEAIASEAVSAGVTDYVQKDSGVEHYDLLANRLVAHAERAREREQRRLATERFRALVEQSLVGIGLSQDGTFEYVNPRFADLFGYRPDEPVLSVIDERDHDRVRTALRDREAGRVDSLHYVVTARHRDGHAFDIEVHGSQVTYDGEPAVLGVVVPVETETGLAATDAAATADLAGRLEEAATTLGTVAEGDGPADAAAVAGAAETVRTVADTLDPDTLATGAYPDEVDVGQRCRQAWSATVDPKQEDAELTAADGLRVLADEGAVDRLFVALWRGWAAVDEPVSAEVSPTEDGFEVAVEHDGADLAQPPDPPAVSEAVRALGWTVATWTTDTRVVYTVGDVTTPA